MSVFVLHAQDSLSVVMRRFPGITNYKQSAVSLLCKPNTVYQDWGLFCKSEWQINKSLPVPIRFRLGDFDYTSRRESGYKLDGE